MGDMGQQFADLKRRVMALEADPNVIAAQTDAKQIFADGLARVNEAIQNHRRILAEAIKDFSTKGEVAALGNKLASDVQAMFDAHKTAILAALEAHSGDPTAHGAKEPVSPPQATEGDPSVPAPASSSPSA